MEGCSLEVDQSWLCSGVLARSPMRDCSSLLYEKGSACCECHRRSHRGFEEGGGRPKGTPQTPLF